MKSITPQTLPDELIARCKEDPEFREDTIHNLRQAISNAQQIEKFLTRDLQRVLTECNVALDVARTATK